NPKVLKSGIHTDEFYKEMWVTIKSGNTWEGEFCNRKKNGELFWEKSIITPIQNEKKEIVNFIAVKSDITNEKKHKYLIDITLEIYEKSEQLTIEEILKLSIELGIQLTNSEIGFFHFVNAEQKTISLQAWSVKTMEICNIPTLDKHYPISEADVWVDCFYQKKPVFHNDYSGLPNKKGLTEGHATIIRDLSVPVIIENQIVAIFGVGNKVLDYDETDAELLSIFAKNVWNVIRRKNAENDTIKAKEKAEESDRLKSQFLLNMSHEVRTPMNAINGFSNMLNKPDLSEEKRKKFTSIIINSSNQLQSIVENILTISALETKVEKTTIQPVNINKIIVDLLTVFKTQAFNSNISIYSKQKLTDIQSEIYSDQTKITQILSNLLTNALKFTHEGYVEFGYTLKTDIESANMEFYVKDTGIGIKPELQEKIFERFIQVETGFTRQYGGNGLG
ncbi:MAG: GAF domain-containing protein, partial [Bacteroidales bacterium]|nr:GAF domain-containing protein [Bacteroidales bacterium]